jgi:hypothetical protein
MQRLIFIDSRIEIEIKSIYNNGDPKISIKDVKNG